MAEDWSWSKWFKGFVEGRRYGKDIAILLRFAVIVAVVYLCVMGILWTKEKFFPQEEKKPKVENIAINSGGAPVNNSKAQSEFNLLNLKGWFGGQREVNEQ